MNDTQIKSLIEIVLDEQRLVTYISVSKELCIHVNEAKSLLSQVIEVIKEKNSAVKLNISYIISGLLKDNNARTTVCSDLDLKKIKGSFKIIYFEHIYSVGLGKPKLDPIAFVTIHKFDDISLCPGLIKSNSCLKHSSDEIGALKTNGQIVLENTNPLQKESKSVTKEVKAKNGDIKNVTKLETQSEPSIKTEHSSPKKSLLIKTSDKKNGSKGSKSITGFFSKANTVPSSKASKSLSESPKLNENIEIEKEVIDKKVDVVKNIPENGGKTEIKTKNEVQIKKIDEVENIPENISKIDIKGKSIHEPKTKKPINHIKKNAKVDKKRKRVLHISDSESDNERNDPFADEMPVNEESEDEIPPTPNTNTVKITSGVLNPKKRRKIVDKTYTDDDGYILTKKEEVYESCSENEEEVHTIEKLEKPDNKMQIKTEVSPKEKKAKNTKKKVSPPQKGKQATMMNFFKKV